MQEHDAMSKIFRVALLIFATTFGIGLYALIGAPILRINYVGYASSMGSKVASVGASALKSLPIPRLIPEKGVISYEITRAANDFPLLKNIILSESFGGQTTREIVFTKDNEPVSGETLFAHFAERELPASLGHLLLDQRYFIKHDDVFRGALFISTTNNDAAYAAILQNETLLATAMMNLVHPTMSVSEVQMLAKIRFVSRKIGTVDARAITTSSDEPILIWGTKDNLVIVAGDKESFIAATENDRP